eukprot:5631093-Pyramimonas_sp.AAC.1
MKRFRVAAASYIKTAKSIYGMNIQEELEQLNTYSAAWNEFADTIVEQILEANRNFARTPMIADGPRWSRRKTAEGSGSKVRVPTPPAPPSGSAGAERESRREAQDGQSSPTQ